MILPMHEFDWFAKMKKIVFAVALLLLSGCQSPHHNSHWLTPKKGTKQFLGQAPQFEAAQFDPFVQSLQSVPAQNAQTPTTIDPFAPIQLNTGNTGQALRESELERIRSLATASREGAPDYLQPFTPWSGPFANRSQSKTLEQDYIQQAGYRQVAARDYPQEYEFDWEKSEKTGSFDWSVLDPANFFSRVRNQMGFGPDEDKANESMRKGREILLANPDLKNRKQNLEAAKHFMEAANRFPDSVLEEDALHLAAECYFFADDYPNAFTTYQKLVVKYQHSRHVDNAVRRLFQIGNFWEQASERTTMPFNVTNQSLPRFDTFGHAKKAYETIFTYDPLGPVSDAALMALANAYLKRGRYQGDDNFNQAAFYYQRIREEHPTSPYISRAYKNELYARTRAYLGAEHPGGTLNEARRLAEVTLWQFRTELDSEGKSGVLEIKEGILSKEAERLWSEGQFWDLKKRHYGAARISYNRLITEYPQTEFAERARQRLMVIEGLPDVPPIFGFPVNPFKAVK